MWIDKNERLPELNTKVAVWVPQENEWFEDYFTRLSDSDGGTICLLNWYWHNVSHWMELPKPPNAFGVRRFQSRIYDWLEIMNRLYENEIFNSHPETSKDPIRFKADALAMELVKDRQSKRELVDVIRWLIMDNAKTVNEALSNATGETEQKRN